MRTLPLLLAAALSLTACSTIGPERPYADSAPLSGAWYYRPALHALGEPVVTVSDARTRVSPSYVERAHDGAPCIVHMPAPDSAWRLSPEHWRAVWVKEASVCTGPDGNSWLDRARYGRAMLEVGNWTTMDGIDVDRIYAEMGGPANGGAP